MNKVLDALKQQMAELEKASGALAYSLGKCSKTGIHTGLSDEELESLEALTSRFARLSDILIQKILRYFDTLDLEDQGTVRDRINRAEKKEIISSAEEFIEIRLLRNEIAHEYKADTIYDIFERVLVYSPVLMEAVDHVTAYAKRYDQEK